MNNKNKSIHLEGVHGKLVLVSTSIADICPMTVLLQIQPIPISKRSAISIFLHTYAITVTELFKNEITTVMTIVCLSYFYLSEMTTNLPDLTQLQDIKVPLAN